MKTKFLLLLAMIAALSLVACGSDDSETESSSTTSTTSTTSNADGNGVDRAFIAAMIPHHEGAVDMARIARERGESEFVTTLADNIIRSQTAEIDTMKAKDAELAKAGVEEGTLDVPEHMRGMHTDMAALETANPFDEEFLKMMIPHHEGAITMSEEVLASGSDPEVAELARQIIDAQEKEISKMHAQLGEDSRHSSSDGESMDHGS